jgi:cell division protein FtsN/nucleoid DNA-binding protein
VNISHIIRELLLHNQQAVVPGFGTFLIQHHPARLNKVTHVLTPPSAEIRFNNEQQSDDGQLSRYLVQKLKLNETEAREAIDQFLKTANDHFRDKGTFLLEGIGLITREKSGRINFKPDTEMVKRANMFELPKLDIPVERTVSPGVVIEQPMKRSTFTGRNKRRRWILAVIIALLIGLSAVVYFAGMYESFMTGHKTKASNAVKNENPDKLVFGNQVATDSNRIEIDTLREKISRELDRRTARENALLYKEDETKPAEEIKNAVSKPIHPVLTVNNKPYHIIAGAFLVPNNAERKKLQLEGKGFSPALLPKRGDYYMVSLGSYDSQEQAVEAMRLLRLKLKQELWVMKMQ